MAQTTTSHATLGKAVKKATKRLVPILLLMYILAFLDRANLGFAEVRFQAGTGISDAAYALGAGIFFLGYALFEVPGDLIVRTVGAKAWLARIMISWGIVSALMMFAANDTMFYILRVALGITEAGFLPGWQIMFLVTGPVAVLVGLATIAYLDNGPRDAKWLTEDENATLIAAVETEDPKKPDHSPRGALPALGNPKVLYFGIALVAESTERAPATAASISRSAE